MTDETDIAKAISDLIDQKEREIVALTDSVAKLRSALSVLSADAVTAQSAGGAVVAIGSPQQQTNAPTGTASRNGGAFDAEVRTLRRRSSDELAELDAVAIEMVQSKGRVRNIDLHAELVARGLLEDSRADVEASRNTLKRLERAARVIDAGGGFYELIASVDQSGNVAST